MTITGRDLIDAGLAQGPWIPDAVAAVNNGSMTLREAVTAFSPAPGLPLQDGSNFHVNIDRGNNELEQSNRLSAVATMTEVMRTPVVKAGALMPDACPAGPLGTIPVGGVAASEAIHPGMHSADICCSVMLSEYKDIGPKDLLDTISARTHFGPGGRPGGEQFKLSDKLANQFSGNRFLKDLLPIAQEFLGTQGDGNHFAFVGIRNSTGNACLVTHHGSRKPGAMLYKRGMAAAIKHTKQVSPETLKQNAWIDADSEDGEEYWRALQIIREWTKKNHESLHYSDELAPDDNFWNEHNFVFRKTDGLFYHGKGATPAFDNWATDATDLTLIPLNMAEPILIAKGLNASNGLGFSPHGAGRNYSRTQHKKSHGDRPVADIVAEETAGLDVRFHMGTPDVSELPSAYKDAAEIKRQINEYGLADVVDEVAPYGSIMAGDWEQNAPWKKKRK